MSHDISKDDQVQPDDGAEFTGAMDELVKKYDEIISEFNALLDKQTKQIFNDPDLRDQ